MFSCAAIECSIVAAITFPPVATGESSPVARKEYTPVATGESYPVATGSDSLAGTRGCAPVQNSSEAWEPAFLSAPRAENKTIPLIRLLEIDCNLS